MIKQHTTIIVQGKFKFNVGDYSGDTHGIQERDGQNAINVWGPVQDWRTVAMSFRNVLEAIAEKHDISKLLEKP